ncbi:hypothetical protein ACF3NA_04770 [Alkanindiges sp. WGS2144]|uniref:hypothetical protein n=1 Tax=Alkanindiges sp. WGS2144 TaxID=3366808 RepID=UPI0037504A71
MGWKGLLATLLTISTLSHAQVMKCIDSKGSITFSDSGCHSSQKSSMVKVIAKTNTSQLEERPDYSYDQPYSKASLEREQRYNTRMNEYRKSAKYASDRYRAQEYEDEIRRTNEERMRNMDQLRIYGASSNTYPATRKACQYFGNQLRCN